MMMFSVRPKDASFALCKQNLGFSAYQDILKGKREALVHR